MAHAPCNGKRYSRVLQNQVAHSRRNCADGAGWIKDCVEKYCPNSEQCVDPFHVVMWANDALDKVRIATTRDAKKMPQTARLFKAVKKTKKGEKKNLTYSLRKNPENLTANQQVTMEMLIKTDPRTYRAYLLKEGLRLCFRYSTDEAIKELDKWLIWAQRCRIPEFVELGRKIKRHKNAIHNSFKYRLTNARVEAVNNNIKVTVRMGYGYRDIDSLISLVKLKCGGYDIQLFKKK